MPAAAQRTIETIEAEIELAQTSYSAAVSYSIAMNSAYHAAFRAVSLAKSKCSAGLNAAKLANSEVDQTAEDLQTLRVELAALQEPRR